ncbi:2447_t:CDS:2, partial [Gigaspora rosea]
DYLDTQLEELKIQLNEEAMALSEKWRLEKVEKIAKQPGKINIPNEMNDEKDILQYVRNYYAKIYEKEKINKEVAEELT